MALLAVVKRRIRLCNGGVTEVIVINPGHSYKVRTITVLRFSADI